MNTKRLLVAVASIALMAASSGAIAQERSGGHGAGGAAPSANGGGAAIQHGGGAPMQGAPTGMNHTGGAGQPHATSGQAQAGQAQGGQVGGGAGERNIQLHGQVGQAHQNGRVGQMNNQVQPNRRAETTGQGARGQGAREERRGFAEERGRAADHGRVDTGREERLQDGRRAFDNTNRGERTTTGQGVASTRGAASLTSEQRTRVHDAFGRVNDAPRLGRADFDVAVGSRVPRSVHFIPVPEAIYAIAPAWRGYDYFEVADEIVILDPVTLEIVAVLPV